MQLLLENIHVPNQQRLSLNLKKKQIGAQAVEGGVSAIEGRRNVNVKGYLLLQKLYFFQQDLVNVFGKI
jgi:hypothetical protein